MEASRRTRVQPVPASVLADGEAARRDGLRARGPCHSGCRELDEYVLMGGGFERGSVVGVSADDSDGFGLAVRRGGRDEDDRGGGGAGTR